LESGTWLFTVVGYGGLTAVIIALLLLKFPWVFMGIIWLICAISAECGCIIYCENSGRYNVICETAVSAMHTVVGFCLLT
jgi:hypothetical protein